MTLWGALWWHKNSLDGDGEHLLYDNNCKPAIFITRKESKKWIDENYSYIKTRKDLRAYPHGWRLPKPVRLTIGYLPLK